VDEPDEKPASTDEPAAVTVNVAEPGAAEADLAVPGAANAGVAEPGAAEADMVKASSDQPAAVKPNVDRLQMIQGVITRLAANSGALKGFAVPVITALLGVGIGKNSAGFVWLAVYPVVVFGFLDAYYLALEKRYRDLYKRAAREPETEWSLAAGQADWREILDSWRSPSVWAFYGAALVVVIAVALII
jgi:hypothetical protein